MTEAEALDLESTIKQLPGVLGCVIITHPETGAPEEIQAFVRSGSDRAKVQNAIYAEAVLVVFDPAKVSYTDLLTVFWESHDPTQGMQQGNDVGTQYRSAIYYANDEQKKLAEESRDAYEQELKKAGYGEVTTEIAPAGPFYFAEDYHQQYLYKVPNGYCGIGGTGVSCPVGLTTTSD